jgi:hypothetical protein
MINYHIQIIIYFLILINWLFGWTLIIQKIKI